MAGAVEWHIAGTYLESCNCDAICPCRRIGGRSGGRSTHGECLGALSWLIREGAAGDVGLANLGVVLASRYHDDEPGSPWTFYLYIDERASAEQHDVLAAIFTGKLGGTPMKQFPWAFKPADLLGVKRALIDIDHTPGRGFFRVGGHAEVLVREPVPDQEPVTCVIPGHDRSGQELTVDRLAVEDAPLTFEYAGVCAYEATFEYSSAEA